MLRSSRIISFSLWGADRLYNVGAVENAKLAKVHYPTWLCRFYCSEDAPAVPILWRMNCEIVVCTEKDGDPYFWRFRAASDPHADFTIFRDCDSRINPREAVAVADWQASGRTLHTMHDHKEHTAAPILAGMWGIRGGRLEIEGEQVAQWRSTGPAWRTGPDQDFLQDVVWPAFANDHLGHAQDDLITVLRRATGIASHHPFPPHGPLEFAPYVGARITV
jgi:hypothetical protein